MFNIHLVRDEKFINSSFEIFERFYPNKNLFVVDTNETDKKYVNQRDNVIFLPFSLTFGSTADTKRHSPQPSSDAGYAILNSNNIHSGQRHCRRRP